MVGKAKVEARFLRVHASGVPEAASFGSFRAGLGGDFHIGTASQPIDPALSFYSQHEDGPASRSVLSAAAGIAHCEGQKGLSAVEALLGHEDARTKTDTAVLSALEQVNAPKPSSKAA